MIKQAWELQPGDIISDGWQQSAIVALVEVPTGVQVVLACGAKHLLPLAAQIYVFGNLDDQQQVAAVVEQRQCEATQREAAARRAREREREASSREAERLLYSGGISL